MNRTWVIASYLVLAATVGLVACGKKEGYEVQERAVEAHKEHERNIRFGFVEYKLEDGTRCVVYSSKSVSCDWRH